jgi:O-antigen/teichoic acid export membrane protein
MRAIYSGVAAQLCSNLSNIIFVSIALGYFGVTDYGNWSIAISVMTYLGLLQLGLGPAVAALIAKSKDGDTQKKIVLSVSKFLAYIALSGLALTYLANIIFSGGYGQDGNLTNTSNSSLINLILVSSLLFFLRIPGSVLSSVLIGLQVIYLERLYAVIFPSLALLVALFLAKALQQDILFFAWCYGVLQLLIILLMGAHLLLRFRFLRFSLREWLSVAVIDPHIILSGARFFAISLSASVVWGADNLVIGYFLGPDAVTPYSITFKLFIAAYSIFIILNSSLWPMFGNAVGNSDWVWADRIYQQITTLAPVIGGLIWIGSILFAESIIDIWTGPSGYAGAMVVFALGGYGYVLSLINANATFLGGINETQQMIRIGFYEAFVNLILSICLIFFLGVGGVALGTFLAAALTAFWMHPRVIARVTKDKVIMRWNPIFINVSILIPSLIGALFLSYFYDGMYLLISGSCIILIYLLACWYWMDLQFIAQYRKRLFKF